MLRVAADDLAPHQVTFYLKDLAADFHAYYDAERVLVDDATVRDARFALLAATQQVLRNGLNLLGVSAPDRMCMWMATSQRQGGNTVIGFVAGLLAGS